MSAVETTAAYTFPRQHVYGAILAMLFAVSVSAFLVFDRAPPLEFVTTDIVPASARPGDAVMVRRNTIWRRDCEGEAWTEIVGSNRIINFYDKGTRYPYDLGETHTDRTIEISKSISAGKAIYRGVVRFRSCGLTSRWRPIDVPYQEVEFEIRN